MVTKNKKEKITTSHELAIGTIKCLIGGDLLLMSKKNPEKLKAEQESIKNLKPKIKEDIDYNAARSQEVFSKIHFIDNKTVGFPISGVMEAMLRALKNRNALKIKESKIPGLTGQSFKNHIIAKSSNVLGLGKLEYDQMSILVSSCINHNTNPPAMVLASRPCFHNWKMEFELTYNATAVTPKQILALLTEAGAFVGLGSWRIGNGGTYGGFKVLKGIN